MSVGNLTRLAVPALVALAVGSAVVPASAQTSTVIIAPSAPPPPRVETIPPPPCGRRGIGRRKPAAAMCGSTATGGREQELVMVWSHRAWVGLPGLLTLAACG